MKKVKVYKPNPIPINTWTFMTIGFNSHGKLQEDVHKFARWLRNDMGINIAPTPVPANGVKANSNEAAIHNAFARLDKDKKRPNFVLVILPEKSTSLYNMVKKTADVDFGFQTVCVVGNKFTKEGGQLGYFSNVGLKVNLKFGGVNHHVEDAVGLIKGGKTMFVGYDVTHPTNMSAAAAEKAPSIVGLVASIDRELGQWPAVVFQNPKGQEQVDKVFTDHFKSRLRLWQNNNSGHLPQNIIIFRDGVSEGQFKMVLDVELPYIRDACRAVYPNGKQPRLTLIVSVKRHQTRFYPTDPTHAHHKSMSPKEGTIVDRGVTNVRYWDFFLQAHASLQGNLPSSSSVD
jgi:Piwi domain.